MNHRRPSPPAPGRDAAGLRDWTTAIATTTTAPSAASLRLHAIVPLRVHEDVVHQIVYAIRSGLLTEGDRLPTIEAISASTGVSKPVVGEAVRVLRTYGVVASKRGVQGGVTVVNEDLPADLLRIGGWRDASLTELVEARRPIERELAQLAGSRATDDDLAAMAEVIGDLERTSALPSGAFLRIDHRFHYLVARAARSEMLAYFQHRVLAATAVYLHEYGMYHDDRALVVETHRRMLDAIETRDPDGIAAATEHHWETSVGAFAGIDLDSLVRRAGV
jgi:GntR family transcriptional regulator, transcriptional repressor for pyruvate dehydrogenase complex